MHYYLTKKAREDGYVVTKIEVTHLGQDYGKVEVHWKNGEIFEYEINDTLAVALLQFQPQLKAEI